MKLRLGLALLALVPLPQAQAATLDVARPAYLNIIVNGANPNERPTFTVQRLDLTTNTFTLGLTVSPRVDCRSVWWRDAQVEPTQKPFFDVSCTPIEPEPVYEDENVRIQGFRCENAAVRASISGPMPNESVTGRIECGQPPQVTGASCTATASGVDPLSGGFSGECFQLAPNGPLPIRCHVELTNVWLDHWQVTCYGTDP